MPVSEGALPGTKGMRIFQSDGKQRMLEGGIGCVRLSSYSKPHGEVYLFTAYTGNSPESRVPIEIGQDLHDAIADEIAQTGCASGVSLSGVLRDSPLRVPLSALQINKPRTNLGRPECLAV